MDFFDEDDPPKRPDSRSRAPREPRRGAGRTSSATAPSVSASADSRRRQGRLRLGLVLIAFVLIFALAVRGCLDARKDRAFQNYARDLAALAAETDQLSEQFFGALSGDPENGVTSLQNQVNGDRGTAQALLDRAKGLDVPDETLNSAQGQLVLSYELRRDALDTIAAKLPQALGDSGAKKATRDIASQMEVFLASDVLFRRAARLIEAEIAEQEVSVDDEIPEGAFLPGGNNDPDYLDLATVQAAIGSSGGGGGGGAGGAGADCDPGDDLVHGLGLVATIAMPSGTQLTPDAVNTLSPDDTELEVQVMNQGEDSEVDIGVALGGDFSGKQTISRIESQATQSVTIPLKPTPSAGSEGTVDVEVATVCGEQVADNNSSSYELAFG